MFNEHLIPLAETIDSARIEANKHVHTESQNGVYGDLSNALKTTLVYITGDWQSANKVYAMLLDGCSVRVALAQFKGELV